MKDIQHNHLLNSIVPLIDKARQRVAIAVNSELALLYWNMGKQINQDILNNARADYGKTVISELSKQLTNLYGSGFSKTNLHNFIKFNELYPDEEIVHSLCGQLTWTHIREIIYIPDNLKREFYIRLCVHEDGRFVRCKTASAVCCMSVLPSAASPKKPSSMICKCLKTKGK